MTTLRIPGTDLDVSAFCLGAMKHGSSVPSAEADRLLDAFRDAGGNFVDTAHCYQVWMDGGDGASERSVGEYIKRQGARDEMVIATKGGHPAMKGYRRTDRGYLTPNRIEADIDDSLARLQIDTIDLYWLHRDDPRLPAGEIIEILHAEMTRGRIRHYGGSNWTSARFEEANTYARAHGLPPMVASQPKWNLAEPDDLTPEVERLEPGVCLSVSAADRDWHARKCRPVIPYNPTAGGFFATAGAKQEAYATDAGKARLARAQELAKELGATPNQIALAWLRAQPFPVIPILGTSSLEHLHDALGADALNLTPDQAAWLAEG